MSSVYEVNRGINKPIEFRGLKGQYIWYLAGGLVCLMLLFAVSYIAGVPVYICVVGVAVLGFILFSQTYKLSHKYGQHGLMKLGAWKQVPPAITCRSRRCFLGLLAKSESDDCDSSGSDGSRGRAHPAFKGKQKTG